MAFDVRSCIQLFQERLLDKTTNVHATIPKVVWVFTAFFPRGNACIFARAEFVVTLRRPLSVALL